MRSHPFRTNLPAEPADSKFYTAFTRRPRFSIDAFRHATGQYQFAATPGRDSGGNQFQASVRSQGLRRSLTFHPVTHSLELSNEPFGTLEKPQKAFHEGDFPIPAG